MIKQDYDIITVDHWECPKENDARILAQPNLPYPQHRQNPRTLLARSAWEHMRKACYVNANYTCEICGYKPTYEKGDYCHAHELNSIDHANQTSTFIRCICLCTKCHLLCIHTGRALTLYKKGNPIYPKEALLDGAEHAFTIIHSWNEEHPEAEPLRVFSTWIDYLKEPDLKEPMEKLIDKYGIKFYRVSEKWYKPKYWSNWKLIFNGREYKTPYATVEDWEKSMEENNKRNWGDKKKLVDRCSGGIYDEIEKIIKENA